MSHFCSLFELTVLLAIFKRSIKTTDKG